jgi:hypothetical protein
MNDHLQHSKETDASKRHLEKQDSTMTSTDAEMSQCQSIGFKSKSSGIQLKDNRLSRVAEGKTPFTNNIRSRFNPTGN